jgi:hypothetical protein
MAINKIKSMYIHEILDRVAEASTRKEKVEILREYNTPALRDILKGAFDDNVEFNLPKGAPPYTPGSAQNPGSTLRKQHKKFRHFASTPQRRKAGPKVETIFIKMLESLHPEEAQLVLWMKDKDLGGKYKGLTKKIVSDAFPGLISE